MSWEAWGSGEDMGMGDEHDHLLEAGWWTDDKVKEVCDAIEALSAIAFYTTSSSINPEIHMRIALLRNAAGLDVPPELLAEAEAHFQGR